MQDELRLREIEIRLAAIDTGDSSPALIRSLQEDLAYLLTRVRTQDKVLQQFWEILHTTRAILGKLESDEPL